MRSLFVFALSLMLFALPANGQDTGGKTKSAPPARTVAEGLKMPSGPAAVNAFIRAYAASDYMSAYYLLSPDARLALSDLVSSDTASMLFPKLPAGQSIEAIALDQGTTSAMLAEIQLDGALTFDMLMIAAERSNALPFSLDGAGEPRVTIDEADQGRFIIATQGDPSFVIISTVRLENGDWRVSRVVWATSDPEAQPWGRK